MSARRDPDASPGPGSSAGRWIEVTAWVGDVIFAATAVPVALGVDSWSPVAIGTALALFLVGLVVWLWALGAAFVRSAGGDHIAVGSLFLVEGSVPRRVRWSLFGALAACLAVTVGTAAADPFGVLVPLLPLGLIGLWGARHGAFPERRDRPVPGADRGR